MKLSEAQLRGFVDARYIDRGRDYAARGLVVLKEITNDTARAMCTGSRVYEIELTLRDGQLDGECSCPAFDEFGPCKHIAATALAVMAAGKGSFETGQDAEERVDEHDQIRAGLMRFSKADLVAFLMNTVDEEDLYYLLDL